MNKKRLSEQEIRTRFILPALQRAGWDVSKQVREDYPVSEGQIRVTGKTARRLKARRADYVLFYKSGIPIAVIEAKNNRCSPGSGIRQALEYAGTLDVQFAYSCNGDLFIEHDRTGGKKQPEKEFPPNKFPGPQELWERYRQWKNFSGNEERIFLQDYHIDHAGKTPRHYQMTAINRVIGAIAKGQKRILLVMATGTGKTYTAFQIAWRLWKARAKKRILFITDRVALLHQAMTNDFKHFDEGAGTVVCQIKNKTADTSYQLYMALYQALYSPVEEKKLFQRFAPGFFDLIIVDECHRGSADADSEWREILEYFSSAVQVGLTATPRETRDVSNISYFGEPAVTYSLKRGTEDGYLAPFRVIRVVTDADDGWRPTAGQKDKYGEVIPDKVYRLKDFDRPVVLEERIKLVAQRITEYLKQNGRYTKTIVFCQDIEHAENMRRAIVNENPDLCARNHRYVVRITGDSEKREQDIYDFTDVSSPFPTIALTSRLLSTGIDAPTCRLIVLDKHIESQIEFKQIIGRGTRVREDLGKMYFTIMDFRGVTRKFADPGFDGAPVCVYEPGPGDPVSPPEDREHRNPPGPNEYTIHNTAGRVGLPKPVYGGPRPPRTGRRKYYIDGDPVRIIDQKIQYNRPDGKLIIESIRSYCRQFLKKRFPTLRDFLARWDGAKKKTAFIKDLETHGLMMEELKEEIGNDFDEFDLIRHIAFEADLVTRRERSARITPGKFSRNAERLRPILDALLATYIRHGIGPIEDTNTLNLPAFKHFGTSVEIVMAFGGKKKYETAILNLEKKIYTPFRDKQLN